MDRQADRQAVLSQVAVLRSAVVQFHQQRHDTQHQAPLLEAKLGSEDSQGPSVGPSGAQSEIRNRFLHERDFRTNLLEITSPVHVIKYLVFSLKRRNSSNQLLSWK